jgi:hypothetical protein
MRPTTAASALLLLTILVSACALLQAEERPDPPNGPVAAEIAPDLLDEPAHTADDAVAISREFLDRMRPIIAAPELHVVASIATAHAVKGTNAWMIDPCIPQVDDQTTVWITEGVGDYLNLVDFAWSHNFGQFDEGFALACQGTAPSGTIVIDDTTGYILGVYPGDRDTRRP